MFGAEVREKLSTATPPFLGLRATPAFSSPRPVTLGCRPIANITWFDAMLDPLDRCEVYSLLRLSIPVLIRSEEHTSELQSRSDLVCRLLLEKKKKIYFLLFSQKKKLKTKNT